MQGVPSPLLLQATCQSPLNSRRPKLHRCTVFGLVSLATAYHRLPCTLSPGLQAPPHHTTALQPSPVPDKPTYGRCGGRNHFVEQWPCWGSLRGFHSCLDTAVCAAVRSVLDAACQVQRCTPCKPSPCQPFPVARQGHSNARLGLVVIGVCGVTHLTNTHTPGQNKCSAAHGHPSTTKHQVASLLSGGRPASQTCNQEQLLAARH